MYFSVVDPSSHIVAAVSSQVGPPHWWTWPGRAREHWLLRWRGSRL